MVGTESVGHHLFHFSNSSSTPAMVLVSNSEMEIVMTDMLFLGVTIMVCLIAIYFYLKAQNKSTVIDDYDNRLPVYKIIGQVNWRLF